VAGQWATFFENLYDSAQRQVALAHRAFTAQGQEYLMNEVQMSPAADSDERLMQEVAAGRRDRLEVLVRRYAGPLLTYIRRMVGSEHRSEELFQEVFLAVWVKRTQYKFPMPFRAWLFTIATNRCREDFRRPRPEVRGGDLLADESSPSREVNPMDAAIQSETAEAVAKAVAQLPPKQREVVVLRVWNQLSYAEIAKVLGAQEATVRSHMHHGLTSMRKQLDAALT
jgi:RNA polymerase sigma factor (sigma-70 family)